MPNARIRWIVLTLAIFLLLPATGQAYILVLKQNKEIELSELRFVGNSVQGKLFSGRDWAGAIDQVDFQATYLKNREEGTQQGIYLSRGKVLTFESIEIGPELAVLTMSESATITVPLSALDFKTTVIEGRGSRSGAPARRSKPSTRAAPTKSPSSATVRGRGNRHRPTSATRMLPGTVPSRQMEDQPVEEEDSPEFAQLDSRTPNPGAAVPLFEDRGNQDDDDPDANHSDPRSRDSSYDPNDSLARRVTRAEVVQKMDPIFDEQLVPEGRGLTCLLEVTVAASGTVGNVKVIKSTGIPELDAAGVEAAQQFIYNPARKDGVPFESRRLERISFRRSAS